MLVYSLLWEKWHYKPTLDFFSKCKQTNLCIYGSIKLKEVFLRYFLNAIQCKITDSQNITFFSIYFFRNKNVVVFIGTLWPAKIMAVNQFLEYYLYWKSPIFTSWLQNQFYDLYSPIVRPKNCLVATVLVVLKLTM